MLCTDVTWPHKASVKLNNGYIHLQQSSPTPIIMDYESSSDAALLEQEQQPPLNRDTSILLLDVNQQQQQQQPHSNIINNPTSPQHVITVPVVATAIGCGGGGVAGSLRNSISPISTSPTNTTTVNANKSQVVVNLDYPNSMQTVTTLQRNNVKNSSTNSNRSHTNSIAGASSGNMLSTSSIGNNIKANDNGKMFSANNRKCRFNLLKLSASPSSRAGRSTRNRLLIVAICLIIFGIAIGALIVHLSGIYHCDSNRIGMCFICFFLNSPHNPFSLCLSFPFNSIFF